MAAIPALACLAGGPALAADACLLQDFSAPPAAYRYVDGTIGAACGGGSRTGVYAGTFSIVIDPPNPSTLGYCVDLPNPIAGGDCQPQTAPPSYPCQVAYILQNFYPNGPVSAGLTVADEAAAVQAALWSFTDCFTLTRSNSPNDAALRARWSAIVAAANANHAPDCADPVVPARIEVAPDDAANRLPADSTHTVTATVYDTAGQPMANRAVRVSVSGGPSGPFTFQGTTDASGRLAVTYGNDARTPGVDTIVASTSFTVPVGLEFSNGVLQRIVLAGTPRTGTVEGVATKRWVEAFCGDGILDPETEECDDGNTADGDGCSSTCRVEEVCTDLIDNDGDGLIDCDDPDCECQVFGKDPGSIVFRPTRPGQDLFKVHGRLVVPEADTLLGRFAVLLTNERGVVYKGELQPGDLRRQGRGAIFRDPTALSGPGLRDGLYHVRLRRRSGYVAVFVTSYADLSAATLPLMGVQVVVGDEVAFYKSEWRKQANGWRLELPPVR